MVKVALANGYISQNVGNAFFELGAHELISRACGPENVTFIGDLPAHWTTNRKVGGCPAGWWNYLERMEGIDAFVFQGPALIESFATTWDPVITSLRRKGIEPILLSVSFSKYNRTEQNRAIEFIKRHKIETVFTRDQVTFDLLKEAKPSYSGICSAMYLPWAHTPITLSGTYIASTFESNPEPPNVVSLATKGTTGDPWSGSSGAAKFVRRLGKKGSLAAYIGQFIGPACTHSSSDGVEIVRPVHRTNPAVPRRLFRDQNFVASDEPYTYLSVYANAQATVTDRVHAAVAAMIYGGKALLLTRSHRRNLLARVGVTFPMSRPVGLDLNRLEQERQAQLEELSVLLR